MLGHSPYYFSTIHNLVKVFGNIFNEIYITRKDSTGDIVQSIKVPLMYASKDKLLLRVDSDPNLNRPQAITLPRMAYELTGLNYDGTRRLNNLGKIVRKDSADANKFKRVFNPVPYNFDFNLYIQGKNQEDCLKVVEQILPFFGPEFTPTIELIPEIGLHHDIPIELQAVGFEDVSDGALTERRQIIWTLAFTIRGVLYGPVVSKPIIKVAKTQFLMSNTVANNDLKTEGSDAGKIIVKPGLTANGEPTTVANNSINWNLIEVDDDFGFIVEREGIVLEPEE